MSSWGLSGSRRCRTEAWLPAEPLQGLAPLPGHSISVASISVAVPPGWQQTMLQGTPGITLLRPEGVDDLANRWRALPYAQNNEQ
jgi:hypothetical protein